MNRIANVVVFSLLGSHAVFAQCSDAGICVIGSHGQEVHHQVAARYVFGKSGNEDGLTFHSVEVEGRFEVFSGSQIAAVLPWSRIDGPLGNASGLGDLKILWDQNLSRDADYELSAQVGAKLATGISNAASLPQSYQPGLGTNDLLLGMSYKIQQWRFAVGYQLSRGRSDNALTRLRRGDDLLVRTGYERNFEKLAVGLEALAIKRLHRSSVLDTSATGGGAFIDVPGSDQFQVNLLATAMLPLSDAFSVRAYVAFPLRNRDVNVDGLTRSISLSLGLQTSI